MGKQATIRDVAKLAGVSLATVSRVLNDGNYPVSAELKQRVREAVEQLDYVPNTNAQSLRKDTGRDVGLVIPNISNPFYLQTMLGIDEVLAKNNYNIILCNTLRNPAVERDTLRKLYERQVKGVILSSVDENAQIIQEYINKGMKFVLLDQKLTGSDSAGINFDARAGARMATEYLMDRGHERIGYLKGSERITNFYYRQLGYERAHQKRGVQLREEYSLMLTPTMDGAHRDMRDCLLSMLQKEGLTQETDVECLLESADREQKNAWAEYLRTVLPTAYISDNDIIALGAIKGLKEFGLKIPADISVIGFDDMPFCEISSPALTTLRVFKQEMGIVAVKRLLEHLADDKVINTKIQVCTQFVERDSVRDLRA